MALTKISTDGVKDDAVTAGKIPANAVGSSELATSAVIQDKISSNAVVESKIAPDAVGDTRLSDHASDNSLRAVGTNHIKDQAVTLAKLPHGDSNNNGKFLRANNGADPSFETVSIPAAVGGANGVDFNDDVKARFGTGNDLEIYHSSDQSYIKNSTGNLRIEADALRLRSKTGPENYLKADVNGAVELYYDNGKRLETTSGGVDIDGTTDGVLNINTTDSRGSFIRFQESGTSKCFIGCGQGLSLGAATDLGLRAENDIRFRTGTEEHAVLTNEGYFAAKGMAGNWVSSNTHPSSSQFHQFTQTGTGRRIVVFRQEHHAGLGVHIEMSNTGNQEALYMTGNGTTRFRVFASGNVGNTNNSYGSLSDIKLKENIVDAKSQWDDIKAVKVRNFNFKDTPDTKMLGVVAQEIETVCPSLVSEIVDRDPDTNEALETTTKEVKYSILYMKAIKALQEAMAKIEVLETKVAALEAG